MKTLILLILIIGLLSINVSGKVTPVNYLNTPNRFIAVNGVRYAYRKLGRKSTFPLVMLQHFRGSMDYWDPALIDALAKERTVIVFDNKGVSLSGGQTPDTFAAMGDDAARFIEALGYHQVDLLGFSIGGAVAQELTVNHPQLVRKLILAATAPKGGQFINKRDPKIIAIVTQPTPNQSSTADAQDQSGLKAKGTEKISSMPNPTHMYQFLSLAEVLS